MRTNSIRWHGPGERGPLPPAVGIVTCGGNPVIELPNRIAAALRDRDTKQATRLQKTFDHYSHTKHTSQLPEITFVKAAGVWILSIPFGQWEAL